MPLDEQQIETALAIQSEMIAQLWRWMIGQGHMTEDDFREALATAQDDRAVSGRLFAGPLAPLYLRVLPDRRP